MTSKEAVDTFDVVSGIVFAPDKDDKDVKIDDIEVYSLEEGGKKVDKLVDTQDGGVVIEV